MLRTATFILFGYLSGSVLYARIFLRLFQRENMLAESRDGNPGTANAFMCGGFWCGFFTLLADVLKGFVPVFVFLHSEQIRHAGILSAAVVIAAPVVGHAFSIFYSFKGGKGIATTFGCLAGLLPVWRPIAALAAFFIFFSVVLRVTPHFQRTLAAYLCALVLVLCVENIEIIKMGFLAITATVCVKMLASKEEREKMEVSLLWKH